MDCAKVKVRIACFATSLVFATCSYANDDVFESQVSHEAIASDSVNRYEVLMHGLRVFATPFTKDMGYGDGPMDPGVSDRLSPGNRPSLQSSHNSSLRINGLDAQSCLECHGVQSMATMPMTFNIGGVGALSAAAIFQPTQIDITDTAAVGHAAFNGRFINPPFNYGGGLIELLAKEMTQDLQAIKAQAQALAEGSELELLSKGVSFGFIRSEGAGETSLSIAADGYALDEDLVVRPFGRKGDNATLREFDLNAMQFHFGMQPVELVGEGVDEDADGVADEITVGDISSLTLFLAALPAPIEKGKSTASLREGEKLFHDTGCADCHIPQLETRAATLSHSYPEIHSDPLANVFAETELSGSFTRLLRNDAGGLSVRLFADLKRHYMGPDLAESAGTELDAYFTTARLWGVADTAPYMHDGRAHTLSEAILMHGGDALSSRDSFAGLDDDEQESLLEFLNTLRTPPDAELDRFVKLISQCGSPDRRYTQTRCY